LLGRNRARLRCLCALLHFGADKGDAGVDGIERCYRRGLLAMGTGTRASHPFYLSHLFLDAAVDDDFCACSAEGPRRGKGGCRGRNTVRRGSPDRDGARRCRAAAQRRSGVLCLDRRPGRNRHYGFDPWKPLFQPRYVIGSLPPLLLLSAFGWAKYTESWHGAMVPTTVIMLVAGVGLAYLYYNYSWYPKNDYRSVAFFLDQQEQQGDCILLVPEFETVALNLYRR